MSQLLSTNPPSRTTANHNDGNPNWRGKSVDHLSIAQHGGVYPATAARSAGGHSELLTTSPHVIRQVLDTTDTQRHTEIQRHTYIETDIHTCTDTDIHIQTDIDGRGRSVADANSSMSTSSWLTEWWTSFLSATPQATQWHHKPFSNTTSHSVTPQATQWHHKPLSDTTSHSVTPQAIQWHHKTLSDTTSHLPTPQAT